MGRNCYGLKLLWAEMSSDHPIPTQTCMKWRNFYPVNNPLRFSYPWIRHISSPIFRSTQAKNTVNVAHWLQSIYTLYYYPLPIIIWHCLRVRYRTSRLRGYGSGTRPLDTDSRGLVPDPEPRLWGLSRGPVVCETTTDKSRDTGPYCTYVVTVILPTKTHVEVSLCFARHLWSSRGNQSVFTVMRHTIQTIKLILKVYK